MAAPKTAVGLWGQYLAARMADMSLTIFDVRSNLATAAALGRLMYRLDRRHRLRTIAHLKLAFPEMSDSARAALARRSFEHFVQLVVEICHSPRLFNFESWPRRVTFHNVGRSLDMINAGRSVIMVTGHLGNWEALGGILGMLGYPIDAIARPIDNRLINDWLLGIREKRGMRIITKWDATDRMVEVLSSGGVLGFIADQNAGDRGLFVPFFGKLASTYKSIGLLAMTQQTPIVCGYARRVGSGYRFEMGVQDIIEPADWEGRPDPLYYITARYMRALEMTIRQTPEQYLWMHRRWKSRPRFERQGKPMPDSLRRNLEALPWMDEATLASVSQPVNIA